MWAGAETAGDPAASSKDIVALSSALLSPLPLFSFTNITYSVQHLDHYLYFLCYGKQIYF